MFHFKTYFPPFTLGTSSLIRTYIFHRAFFIALPYMTIKVCLSQPSNRYGDSKFWKTILCLPLPLSLQCWNWSPLSQILGRHFMSALYHQELCQKQGNWNWQDKNSPLCSIVPENCNSNSWDFDIRSDSQPVLSADCFKLLPIKCGGYA